MKNERCTYLRSTKILCAPEHGAIAVHGPELSFVFNPPHYELFSITLSTYQEYRADMKKDSKSTIRVLGIVPARGGSKGVPRKNVRPLNSKPLLQFTAEAALASRLLSRVILSTDDPAIARVGKNCGLEVPFLRPPELAQDETPMLPVVQHAVRYMESLGLTFDAICILQPTSPLRKSAHIDACIQLMQERNPDAVVTVSKVPDKFNPHWTYFQDSDDYLRLSTGEAEPITSRQALPPAFYRDGNIFVVKRDVCMEQNSLFGRNILGYQSEPPSIEINTLEDWERVERLLNTGPTKVVGSR